MSADLIICARYRSNVFYMYAHVIVRVINQQRWQQFLVLWKIG